MFIQKKFGERTYFAICPRMKIVMDFGMLIDTNLIMYDF